MMIMGLTSERRSGCRRDTGSALILTVVLTSLLAIVGVLFLMAARIDKMSTSATADNRQLGFAVDSVVAQIDEVLAKDVPGFSPVEEYYDYPDANNAWLADLEPSARKSPKWTSTKPVFDYYWRQISNITGKSIGRVTDVDALTVGEREIIDPLDNTRANADADGDGVGDARWFEVPGLASSKGKPIYAGVRIVDNGAMLNVNTGYKFDPTDPNSFEIDGHSQLQVNAAILAAGTGDSLRTVRSVNPAMGRTWARYEWEVIWQYAYPTYNYTPFDLSDELELRYRYLLNDTQIDTRVENWGLFRSRTISTPVDSDGKDLDLWYLRAAGVDPNVPVDPCAVVPDRFRFDPNYAYRHIATVYNMDRVLAQKFLSTLPGADPNKMLNVNIAKDESVASDILLSDVLKWVITRALAGVGLGPFGDPAQIAANIKDYIDDDDDVTALYGTVTTSPYFGFERPCVYLSELAYRSVRNANTNLVHKSYAVELCKPYFEDRDPCDTQWRLVIRQASGTVTQLIKWSGTRQFHVLMSEDSEAAITADHLFFEDLNTPPDPALVPGYNPARYSQPAAQALDSAGFSAGASIELQRKAVDDGGRDLWFSVDQVRVPASFDPNTADGAVHTLQRDISVERCIFRFWGPADPNAGKTLGNGNSQYVNRNDPRKLQAHPANAPLLNIGELGKIFAKSAYNIPDPNLASPPPESFLIDLREPVYQSLFNYLTVIDPVVHNSNFPPREMRVKGRININTAPVFVLAQLPWMTQYQELVPLERPRGIVEYRNAHGAFKSIAGLMSVPEMWRLQRDGINNLFDVTPTPTMRRGPDLTFDTVTDDLEERDLIFTRISNLVTVRSDVFTAYILVRIGFDGPQKRVVAIFDRSQTMSPRDPVRVLSVEQVPDPR
jgi:hypothetical protein